MVHCTGARDNPEPMVSGCTVRVVGCEYRSNSIASLLPNNAEIRRRPRVQASCEMDVTQREYIRQDEGFGPSYAQQCKTVAQVLDGKLFRVRVQRGRPSEDDNRHVNGGLEAADEEPQKHKAKEGARGILRPCSVRLSFGRECEDSNFQTKVFTIFTAALSSAGPPVSLLLRGIVAVKPID